MALHAVRRTVRLALFASAVMLPGCIGLGAAHVKPERLFERPPGLEITTKKVGSLSIERKAFALFGIPFATPNLVATVDTQIQAANADAVTNFGVSAHVTNYFLIAMTTYTISGDLIIFE